MAIESRAASKPSFFAELGVGEERLEPGLDALAELRDAGLLLGIVGRERFEALDVVFGDRRRARDRDRSRLICL